MSDIDNGDVASPAGVTESAPAPVADWRASLPEDLRASPSLQDVSDVTTLAKRFVDTKSMVGNSLRVPSDDAGADQIEAFAQKLLENNHLGLMRKPTEENMGELYAALGRPDTPGGYEAPEGTDPETFGVMASVAHELGLTKSQYEKLSAAHAELVGNHIQQTGAERAAGLGQLRGEWGGAYDEKISRVGQLVKAMGGHQGLEAALASNALDAQTLRLFDTIATQFGAEGSQVSKQIGGVNGYTLAELQQRVNDTWHRLYNDNTLSPSQRDELQKKMVSYNEQIVAHST
jgi:hypothetical protein